MKDLCKLSKQASRFFLEELNLGSFYKLKNFGYDVQYDSVIFICCFGVFYVIETTVFVWIVANLLKMGPHLILQNSTELSLAVQFAEITFCTALSYQSIRHATHYAMSLVANTVWPCCM